MGGPHDGWEPSQSMAPMAIVIGTSGGSAGGFRDAARLTVGPLDHHPTRLPDFNSYGRQDDARSDRRGAAVGARVEADEVDRRRFQF